MVWRADRPAARTSRLKPVVLDPPVHAATSASSNRLRISGETRGSRTIPESWNSWIHTARAIGAVDAERLLGDDAQSEVFEDRQHVGERDRLLGPVEP